MSTAPPIAFANRGLNLALPSFSVRVIRGERDFLAIRGAWEELLPHCRNISPSQSWQWLLSWWEHLGRESVLHWSALRVSGALLSTLVSLHEQKATEIGATEGKLLYQKTVMRVTIGAITPILLFSALRSGILGGTIFPDKDLESQAVICASVFWALMSGFAFGSLLNRFHSTFEHAVGKVSSIGNKLSG